MTAAVVLLALAVIALFVYGWLEAGWLRTRVLDVPIAGLPEALDVAKELLAVGIPNYVLSRGSPSVAPTCCASRAISSLIHAARRDCGRC